MLKNNICNYFTVRKQNDTHWLDFLVFDSNDWNYLTLEKQ